MKRRRFRLHLSAFLAAAAAAAALTAAAPARAQGPSLLPGQGLDFYQLNLTFPGASQPASNYGLATLDYSQLASQLGGSSVGYLNVNTATGPDGWVLRNIPIDLNAGYPGMSVQFDLGATGPQSQLRAFAAISAAPVSAFSITPTTTYGLTLKDFNAQGVDALRPAAPVTPINAGVLTFGVPGANLTWQSGHGSIEQDVNQCAPAAEANSFEYLKTRKGIAIPQANQPGIRDASRVGQIDLAMARVAHQVPTWANVLNGTVQYLSDSNLQDNVAVRHKNRAGGALIPNANVTRGNITSLVNTDANLSLSSWMLQELQAGSNVSLTMSYDGGGGHTVDLIGGGTIGGIPWFSFVQDANQGFVNATTTALNGGTGFVDGGIGFSYMVGDNFTYFVPGRTTAARVEYAIAVSAAPEPGTLVLLGLFSIPCMGVLVRRKSQRSA